MLFSRHCIKITVLERSMNGLGSGLACISDSVISTDMVQRLIWKKRSSVTKTAKNPITCIARPGW